MLAEIYPLQVLLLSVSGIVNGSQANVIAYLVEENRVLKEQFSGKVPRLNDDQRRRLAAKAKLLGRRALNSVATIVTPDTLMRWQYVQVRLACSGGVSPPRVRVRSPLAWIALVKETKLMKSIDKAAHGAVSESPGRNESELIGGLVKYRSRRPSHLPTGEGSTVCRRLTNAVHRSGGVIEAAR